MTPPGGEPFDRGRLDVGDGHRVYYEQRGNPYGKPVVCLHGGPGSGCPPGWARWFDPERFRVVLLDQRGCGRSTPSAAVTLAANTTHHLVADLERLRAHAGVERWMLFGGSWGSTLGLAYAVAHPERVSEAVLFSVVTTSRREVEWVTRDVGRMFPAAWEAFRDGVSPAARDGSLVDAYADLLASGSPEVREKAARDWCAWEDAHVAVLPGHRPDPRYADPAFRMVFARLVTHYWRHAAWLPEGALLRGVAGLGGIPAVLVTGRMDVSGPPDVAYHLSRAWPGAELVLVDDAGHGAGHPGLAEALRSAIARFAP
jgi:proline iminopeptidase